jgi:hypothetical protein
VLILLLNTTIPSRDLTVVTMSTRSKKTWQSTAYASPDQGTGISCENSVFNRVLVGKPNYYSFTGWPETSIQNVYSRIARLVYEQEGSSKESLSQAP